MSPTNLTFTVFKITIIFIFCFSTITGLRDETCSIGTPTGCNPSTELLWKTTKNPQRTERNDMVRIPQNNDLNPSARRFSSERRQAERFSRVSLDPKRNFELIGRSNPNNRERDVKQNFRERSNVQNFRNRESQEVLMDSRRRTERDQLSHFRTISRTLQNFRNRESQEVLMDSRRKTERDQLSRFRTISRSVQSFKNRESQEVLMDSRRRTERDQLSRFRTISRSLTSFNDNKNNLMANFRSTRTLRDRQISRNTIRRDVSPATKRTTEDERVQRVANSRIILRNTVRDSRRVITTRQLVQRNSLDNRTFQKRSLYRNEPKTIRQESRIIITREQPLPAKVQQTIRTIPNERTNTVRSDRSIRRTLNERNIRVVTKDQRMNDSTNSIRRVRVEDKGKIHSRNRETSRISVIPSSFRANDNFRNTNDRRIISRDMARFVNNLDFRNEKYNAVNHHGQFVDENNNILKHSSNWANLLTSAVGGLLVMHTILINNCKKGTGFTGFTIFQNLVKAKTG